MSLNPRKQAPPLYPGRVCARINSPVHFIGRGVYKNSGATDLFYPRRHLRVSGCLPTLYIPPAHRPQPPSHPADPHCACALHPSRFHREGESRDEDAQRLGSVAPCHRVKPTSLTGREKDAHTHARTLAFKQSRAHSHGRTDEGARARNAHCQGLKQRGASPTWR